jgi:hypothetical protein
MSWIEIPHTVLAFVIQVFILPHFLQASAGMVLQNSAHLITSIPKSSYHLISELAEIINPLALEMDI